MQRIPLSAYDFSGAFHVPANPLNAPPNTHAEGSRNQLFTGTGRAPWKGMTSLGPGTRLSRQVGGTYGGLRDYISGVTILGKGSFFEDIGKSRWFIGSGIPSVETVDIGAGITAATDLQVSIAVDGVYSAANTFTAGLPQPSAPDIAIVEVAGVGLTGFINGPISIKIARLRLRTGARSRASTTSAVINPENKTIRITFPLPSTGQDNWRAFSTQSGFGGVGLEYALAYLGALDIPESLIAGTAQIETATAVGTITGSGNAKAVVTAAGMTGSPKTITAAVLAGDTNAVVAGKLRVALSADAAVIAMFAVSGTGADVVLTRLVAGSAAVANDATLNIEINNDTCTGLTAALTSVNTRAGVASATVGGVTRSLEFDFKDGDLIPELAYIDDYVPPAGTHAVRLQNVMCLLGCYGDSTTPVSSTNPGTAGAISLPNNYESYRPRDLVYFPEQIVDAMARPTDEFAYVGHADCVTAMQYVGVRDGPAVSVTMVWPDIGIKHPCNWTQVHGLLYVMSATGGPVRMKSDGGVDYDFALPVREFMKTWTQDDTAVGWHPNSLGVVYFNKALGIGISFSLVNEGWGDPCYFTDNAVLGGALSVTNTVGRLIVTVDNGGTHTAYAWNEGATSMPITSVTNWKHTGRPATIEELDIGFDSDSFATPLIISIHRNMRRVYVRDATTTNASATIGSASAKFDTFHTGDMAAIYGPNVGGAGVNYLIGRMTYVSPTTITLSDPYTGAPLAAGATLTNCYMTLACQIFTYTFGRTDEQYTPPLEEPFVDEATSHCFGFTLIIGAEAGQILSATALGTISQAAAAMTT